ncbi:hypothetical protein WJX81_008454 [Elliptochloris bilobata]|uniref:BZIP domain-containing protein n=1 Tax=Elliptochloris bilobata TaxID=381761 RepID=A0AAW1RFD8_9CHLO
MAGSSPGAPSDLLGVDEESLGAQEGEEEEDEDEDLSPPTGSGQTSSSGGGASLALAAAATSGSAASEQRKAKRKKEAPDLESIDDIAERRKQRRLAKNRATAAVSRERKRKQMADLAARVQELEGENLALANDVAMRDAKIAALCGQLASPIMGAAAQQGGAGGGAAATTPEPAVLSGPALPLAVTLQQLSVAARKRSPAAQALAALSALAFFLCLISIGLPLGSSALPLMGAPVGGGGSRGSGDAATQFAGSATGSGGDGGSDDERQLQDERAAASWA